ncbi:MAG: serine/threonine protein phosphatase [Gammaproteobacteria bacterium]|nr:MAG: serine/threonine protein phosphatase [Gammaproteobacteria bacterium]
MNRHLAIGDIHGCITALTSLVDLVGLRPDDTIITLGDYVDRGPDSRAVVDFVINLGKTHHLVALRGNHEIMMLDSREKKSWLHAWMQYGGDATLLSYSSSADVAGSFADVPESHMDFLENQLVAYYECKTHFFVHANADADKPLEDQTDPTLYWKKYGNPEAHCSGKIMVCGHTAQQSGKPSGNEHAICIDTWAHGGGWLSCLDVASGTIWQANESGDRRTLSIAEI